MPKTPKTKLKQPELPVEVHATGNPWEPAGTVPATVPLPNDVIITSIEGAYTERDRKLWAFLVAAVWDKLLTVRIHEIRTSKINAVFQQQGGDTSTTWIWEGAERLTATRARWETGPDGHRLKGIANLLGGAVTHKDDRKSGVLRFEIPALLCEVIRAPCRFSRLRLHFMIGLSGKYAVTLYMLLESVANRDTPVLDVTLPQLRQWLKVPEEKLHRWVDIKRRCLDPSIKQINDNPETAGFNVTMEEIKEGRAVNRVRFVVSKSEARLTEEKNYHPEPSKPALPAAHSSPPALHLPTTAYEQAKKAAPSWDVYELERQWREWMKGKPVPDNPSGAFVNFCKAKAKKSPVVKEGGRPQAAEAKQADAEKTERSKTEMALAFKWFEALPEGEKKALEIEYLAESNATDVGFYKKTGYNYIGFHFFVKKIWKTKHINTEATP
jgi:Initiator Replication protein